MSRKLILQLPLVCIAMVIIAVLVTVLSIVTLPAFLARPSLMGDLTGKVQEVFMERAARYAMKQMIGGVPKHAKTSPGSSTLESHVPPQAEASEAESSE